MENEWKSYIDVVLKAQLKKQDLTVASLARRSGVPASTINQWLTGSIPNTVQAAKVASALSISLYFLTFGKEDPRNLNTQQQFPDIISGKFEITMRRI